MSLRARLALLLAAALALRVAVAPLPSFWVDEAFTVDLLDSTAGGLLDGIRATESTPPLFYVLAWLWSQVAGFGELAVRSVSVVAGAATAGLAFLLGRRSGVRGGAPAAGALAAVSPFLLWFSTDARAYALAAALVTGAFLLMLGALERPRGRWLAGWAVVAALAVATHYATVLLLLPQALVLLWSLRDRSALLATGAVGATGLALVPLAAAQRDNEFARQLSDTSGPLAQRVAQLPKQFAVGFDAPLEIPLAIASLALLAVGIVSALLDPRSRRWAVLLVGLPAAGAGLALVAALAGVVDLVSARYLVPALPALLAVAGAGLVRLRRPIGPVLAVGLAAAWLAADVAIAADPLLHTKADWQGIEAELGPLPPGGRAIVVSPDSGAVVLTRAYGEPAEYVTTPVAVSEVVVAAAVSRGDDLPSPSPIPPAQEPPPFASRGFALVEERVTDSYTLQRWRAPAPTAVDYPSLAAGALDPVRPAAVLVQPGA